MKKLFYSAIDCLLLSPVAQFAFDFLLDLPADLFPVFVLFFGVFYPVFDTLANLLLDFLADLFPLFLLGALDPPLLFAGAPAATEEDGGTQDETEVVPAACVTGLVHTHTVGEQAYDECEETDETVPQSGPETRRGCIKLVVAGRATHDDQEE